MRIIYFLSQLSPRKLKLFAIKKLPIYLFFVLVFCMYGVKGMLITTFLILFFFLGWTGKGMFQAFHDWRLTQRLNRVYFSAADYESIQRENKLLHEALNAFKDNAKKGGTAGVRNDTPMSPPSRAMMNHESIRQMINEMRSEES